LKGFPIQWGVGHTGLIDRGLGRFIQSRFA
jgi:hypothetical protein